MKCWKDHLAKEIMSRSLISREWLFTLSGRYPSLRVKTIDANGSVPVIQFSRKGEWMKPEEWAHNHVANLKQLHSELHQRLINVGCDPFEID